MITSSIIAIHAIKSQIINSFKLQLQKLLRSTINPLRSIRFEKICSKPGISVPEIPFPQQGNPFRPVRPHQAVTSPRTPDGLFARDLPEIHRLHDTVIDLWKLPSEDERSFVGAEREHASVV